VLLNIDGVTFQRRVVQVNQGVAAGHIARAFGRAIIVLALAVTPQPPPNERRSIVPDAPDTAHKWWSWQDTILRPIGYQPIALPLSYMTF
jgi:hypothetical protein